MSAAAARLHGAGGTPAIAAALTAVLAASAIAGGAIELPDAAGALSDGSRSCGAWTYLAAPALAFLETAAVIGLLVDGSSGSCAR